MRVAESVVVVTDEGQPTSISIPPKKRNSSLLSRAIGVVATMLFHLLISSPLLLGKAADKRRPPMPDGPGSVAWASQGSQVEPMVLLDLSALSLSTQNDPFEPQITSEGIELEDLNLALASVEPSPPPELNITDADEAETSNEAAGDPAGSAALFGRYMGQIAARIERAWMRPRIPVAGGRFDCRARIAQDRAGNVQSIELQNCGDDARWRESLTSAILRASPLSAPPEQWLFAEIITLNFAADQYVAKQTPEYNYEPVAKQVARNNAPSAAPPMLDREGDFELTIDGSDVSWIKKKTSVTTRK
jgi:hypothetical protein